MKIDLLQPYLPLNAVIFIEKWIKSYPLTLKITKSRQTKLGDFRKLKHRNQITINGDLNPEAFFFVLTHEIAHMIVYNQFQFGEVAPHGKEWKQIFGSLLNESNLIYQKELQPYILRHAKFPKASVGADSYIAKYLINDAKNNEEYLEDLQIGSKFILNKKIYIKGEKIKLRYVCCELKTQKNYLINATALVEKI